MLKTALYIFMLTLAVVVGYQYSPKVLEGFKKITDTNWDLTDKSYVFYVERNTDYDYMLVRTKDRMIEKVYVHPDSLVTPILLSRYLGHKVRVDGRFVTTNISDINCTQGECSTPPKQQAIMLTQITFVE